MWRSDIEEHTDLGEELAVIDARNGAPGQTTEESSIWGRRAGIGEQPSRARDDTSRENYDGLYISILRQAGIAASLHDDSSMSQKGTSDPLTALKRQRSRESSPADEPPAQKPKISSAQSIGNDELTVRPTNMSRRDDKLPTPVFDHIPQGVREMLYGHNRVSSAQPSDIQQSRTSSASHDIGKLSTPSRNMSPARRHIGSQTPKIPSHGPNDRGNTISRERRLPSGSPYRRKPQRPESSVQHPRMSNSPDSRSSRNSSVPRPTDPITPDRRMSPSAGHSGSDSSTISQFVRATTPKRQISPEAGHSVSPPSINGHSDHNARGMAIQRHERGLSESPSSQKSRKRNFHGLEASESASPKDSSRPKGSSAGPGVPVSGSNSQSPPRYIISYHAHMQSRQSRYRIAVKKGQNRNVDSTKSRQSSPSNTNNVLEPQQDSGAENPWMQELIQHGYTVEQVKLMQLSQEVDRDEAQRIRREAEEQAELARIEAERQAEQAQTEADGQAEEDERVEANCAALTKQVRALGREMAQARARTRTLSASSNSPNRRPTVSNVAQPVLHWGEVDRARMRTSSVGNSNGTQRMHATDEEPNGLDNPRLR